MGGCGKEPWGHVTGWALVELTVWEGHTQARGRQPWGREERRGGGGGGGKQEGTGGGGGQGANSGIPEKQTWMDPQGRGCQARELGLYRVGSWEPWKVRPRSVEGGGGRGGRGGGHTQPLVGRRPGGCLFSWASGGEERAPGREPS